jgi:hypothetical protein
MLFNYTSVRSIGLKEGKTFFKSSLSSEEIASALINYTADETIKSRSFISERLSLVRSPVTYTHRERERERERHKRVPVRATIPFDAREIDAAHFHTTIAGVRAHSQCTSRSGCVRGRGGGGAIRSAISRE